MFVPHFRSKYGNKARLNKTMATVSRGSLLEAEVFGKSSHSLRKVDDQALTFHSPRPTVVTSPIS